MHQGFVLDDFLEKYDKLTPGQRDVVAELIALLSSPSPQESHLSTAPLASACLDQAD